MATVVSTLAQAGADVTVVMTESATRFVAPLTFEALSGNPVIDSPWTRVVSSDPQHIRIAAAADLMLIAPCTMDLVARLAGGFTSDAVTLVASALNLQVQPILLAPSMNQQMYAQPSTQRNLRQLADDGFSIIEPGSGWQACRTDGIGRLPEPEQLVDSIIASLPAMS